MLKELKNITFTDKEIIEQLKLSCKLPEIVQEIKIRKIVEKYAADVGIRVEDNELQKAADKFRLMHNLQSIEETSAWIKKNHLSLDDFENFIYNKELNTKLAVNLFAEKIEPYFYENQLDYAGVVMYEIVLDDEDLGVELFYAIKEKEISFYDAAHKYIQDPELRRKGGYQGILRRKDLKPEISAAVFAVNPPQLLKPIVTSKGVHLILVEEVIQPQLNNFLRNTIGSDLFNEWLKQQTSQLDII